MSVTVIGQHEERTIQQLERCVAAEAGAAGVLCADGHVVSRKANASSFSADRTQFINSNPSPDEVQPRWGRGDMYEMW